MKAIIFLIFCILSLSLFASDGGFVTDKENFNNLMSVEKTEKSLYPWQYSNTSCYAYTRCPNGRVVSCRTFGFAYSAMPAHLSNSCSFAIFPGRGVRCQGYAQIRDYYGRSIWSYVDIPVACY